MQLVIGNEVPAEQLPTSTWLFVVSQMSGDADAYMSESFEIDDEAEATAVAEVLDAIRQIQKHGYGRTTREVEEQLLAKLDASVIATAFGDSRSSVHDNIWEICGNDVTCEGYLACLESFEIFWCDEDGIKYTVKLEK